MDSIDSIEKRAFSNRRRKNPHGPNTRSVGVLCLRFKI